MYVVGGTTSSGSSSGIYSWDIASKAWSTITPTGTGPSARYGQSAVVSGSMIYVFGGMSSSAATNDLFSFDTTTNTWTALSPPGTAPSARYYHGAALVGTKMYIVGGVSGASNIDVYSYDIPTNAWSSVTPAATTTVPTSRSGSAVVANGSMLYVFGGYSGSSYLNGLYAFDTVTNSWSSISPTGTAPGERAYCSAVVNGS